MRMVQGLKRTYYSIDDGGYDDDNTLFQSSGEIISSVPKLFRNSANSEPDSEVVECEFRNSEQTTVFNTFRNSEETVSKRIKLSSQLNSQEGDGKSNEEKCSVLGLTLSKTPSFMNLVEMKLSQSRQNTTPPTNNYTSKTQNYPTNLNDFVSQQPSNEKLKASNFCVSYLEIGSWKRISKHEGDLVAKCYYAKRKFVWEILEGALKSKIEIQWSDIVGIRAKIIENEPGILEIELNQPPLFYRETNPQPRKHTLWHQASDFTGGQAPICRRHYAMFLPGILDKHYEKLLQCDLRLFGLSQKPFPSEKSLYFRPNTYAPTQFSFDFNGFGYEFSPRYEDPVSNFLIPVAHHPVPNFNTTTRSPFVTMDSNTKSVMDFPCIDEEGNPYIPNQRTTLSCQGLNHIGNKFFMGNHIQADQVLPCQDYRIINYGEEVTRSNSNPDPGMLNVINEIENHFLGDSQLLWSDERELQAHLEANPNNYSGMNIPHLEANPNNYSGVNIPHLEVNPSNNYSGVNIQRSTMNGMNDGLAYAKPVTWFPPQDFHENTMMNLQKNELYPYVFQESTVEDFVDLVNTPKIQHWD